MLESVIEKPAEDQINDKLCDKRLKPSEMDKAKEKEVGQASDASHEDLPPASIKSTDLSPKEPEEPKENIPAEQCVVSSEVDEPQQETSVNTPDAEQLATDGQETAEEKEEQEEKTNDELNQEEENKEAEPEKEHLRTDKEEQSEVDAEKSAELEEHPKDVSEEQESVELAQEEEKKEENEGPEELPSQQEVGEVMAEDTTDSVAVNEGREKIQPDFKETTAGGDADTKLRADEAPAAAPTEEKLEDTTNQIPEEKNQVKKAEDEAPEETVLPQQDSQPRQDVEEPVLAGSTNAVSDVVGETSEDTETVPLRKEEEAARADDSSCQDAVSVQESETDSDSKTEQGSPAVVKPDMEKDSDSCSSSAADNSSLDLNLSISSFLSKSKEGGSVSMQVSQCVCRLQNSFYQIITSSVWDCKTSFFPASALHRSPNARKRPLRRRESSWWTAWRSAWPRPRLWRTTMPKMRRCVSWGLCIIIPTTIPTNVAHLTYTP